MVGGGPLGELSNVVNLLVDFVVDLVTCNYHRKLSHKFTLKIHPIHQHIYIYIYIYEHTCYIFLLYTTY